MTQETNPPPKPGSSGPSGSDNQPSTSEGTGQKKFRFGLVYVVLLILAVVAVSEFLSARHNALSYDELLTHVDAGRVQWIELGHDTYHGVLKFSDADLQEAGIDPNMTKEQWAKTAEPRKARGKNDPTFGERIVVQPGEVKFTVENPQGDRMRTQLVERLEAKDVKFDVKAPSGLFPSMLFWMLPFGLLIFVWFMMMRQSGQLGRTAMSFGKSRAKLAEEKRDVTFSDVADCEEAKEELSEVVDFLRSPRKYQTLGGRMPKGILLVGPPGTGKTLLARAVAGEAGKPFFSLSGSDFVEMFVGVGAARVRDLFQQAKVKAPCIVFVDELDAVGRHRGAGLGGGHDEREQTLNQLLVEMDGFDATKGVIFLAATNRPDVLDPALLRPGRFDRQVVIDAPDAKGRRAILEVHARDKSFNDDVDFEAIAARTPGFTGADLANAINEAALLAARRKLESIGQHEIEEAIERVIAGPARRSMRLSDNERMRVAYHEAGHALVAALSEHADPVRKISIVPRGRAAGYTMQTPDEDRYSKTKDQLTDELKTLMAGRAAELLVFDELSTGAGNDLQRGTSIARAMVCRYGMTESLGPVVFGKEHQQVFLGRDLSQEERDYSDSTATEIDREVRKILDDASDAALALLSERRRCLEHIAEILLEKEVMQGKELEKLLEREICGESTDDDAEDDGAEEETPPDDGAGDDAPAGVDDDADGSEEATETNAPA